MIVAFKSKKGFCLNGILILLGLMLILVGCGKVNPELTSDQDLAEIVVKDFVSGKAELNCSIGCSSTSGFYRRVALRLHNSEQWEELAKLVLRIGYDSDQEYYYLGRSAEGLGLKKAAAVYYKKSIGSKTECDYLFNLCDIPNVREVSAQRLKEL